jgi:hypothetical protein
MNYCYSRPVLSNLPPANTNRFGTDSDIKIHCFTFMFSAFEKSTTSLFLLSLPPIHLPACHTALSHIVLVL